MNRYECNQAPHGVLLFMVYYTLMVYDQAKKRWNRYYTRKDWRHTDGTRYWGKSVLKNQRKEANGKLRRFKGDVQNGGWYKRCEEVWWVVF